MNLRAFFHQPADEHFTVPSNRESRVLEMVSKCSNPVCSAPFLYLHSGKLFRFDTPNGPQAKEAPRPPKKIEFFWLCNACVTKFTVVREAAAGTRVVALPPRTRGAAAGL
jgi:hypothetical protein